MAVGRPKKITLSSHDEFEKLLIPMVETNRKKRADYATDGDAYLNFRRNAMMLDLEDYDALTDCLSMVSRKFGRIINLRGRDATNETVVDSYLDMAVYAILAYGLALEAAEEAAE